MKVILNVKKLKIRIQIFFKFILKNNKNGNYIGSHQVFLNSNRK